jgi:hypothetical protein
VTADQRLTAAREFLAGARKHKVAELPPSVLIREDAELRRQLGQVLAVLDESVGVLGEALADAIQYRDPGGLCDACDASVASICDDHADDLNKTDAYLALAAALGIEAGQ